MKEHNSHSRRDILWSLNLLWDDFKTGEALTIRKYLLFSHCWELSLAELLSTGDQQAEADA